MGCGIDEEEGKLRLCRMRDFFFTLLTQMMLYEERERMGKGTIVKAVELVINNTSKKLLLKLREHTFSFFSSMSLSD